MSDINVNTGENTVIVNTCDSIITITNNTQGPAGLSNYDIYIANGGTLSESDWLNTIQANIEILGNVNRDFSTDFENIFLS